jgi:threonine/homoserine efflux transporter RhtA
LIAKAGQYSRVVTLFGVQLKAEVAFYGVTTRRLVVYTKCFVLLPRKKHPVFNGGQCPMFSVHLLGLTNVLGSFVLTLMILFCGIDITVEVRGRVGLLELLIRDVSQFLSLLFVAVIIWSDSTHG